MELLDGLVLGAISVAYVKNILLVAFGLGLVIFFHELGHFAVAKWCNVHVERFSIGFGPILLSRKWGETEYALSAIPFGGYVKMLGQDDLDPSQLSSEDIARNPRSYSSKTVPQRMAIISAGVIMNVVTAAIFFWIAFTLGVQATPPIVGGVQVGMPAWVAGLRQGDRITSINDRDVTVFDDVTRIIALSSGDLRVRGMRPDGAEFDLTIVPDTSGTRRQIGAGRPTASTRVAMTEDNVPVVLPGTAAARAEPPLEPLDLIRRVNGDEVRTFYQLQQQFARHRGEEVSVEVERRDGRVVTVKIPPNPFRTLGLTMDIGKIAAVQHGSPAEQAGLQINDRIVKVGEDAVGTTLDPLRLPELLADRHGQTVQLTVQREVKGAEPRQLTVDVVPDDRAGWLEVPSEETTPLSAPAIGVAFVVIPTILKVEPGSAADKAGIVAGERIRSIEFIRTAGSAPDLLRDDTVLVTFGAKSDSDDKRTNWAHAFWLMQQTPLRTIKISVSDAGGKLRDVLFTPGSATPTDWHAPTRGVQLEPQTEILKADDPAEAVTFGLTHTKNTIVEIYRTLLSLARRDVSPKELSGPVGIAKIAYRMAEQGFAMLMLFLGVLSVNLAVINFLPIPVLDGGHMVFLTWEAVTRKKPSERVLVAAQYFGMLFVLGLMVFVLYLDIFYHPAKG